MVSGPHNGYVGGSQKVMRCREHGEDYLPGHECPMCFEERTRPLFHSGPPKPPLKGVPASDRVVTRQDNTRPLPADVVVLPSHYGRFKIEPIRFIAENRLNWFQGNSIKYTARAEHKHPLPFEDITKSIRYLVMWGKFLCGDPDWWKPYKTDIAGCLKVEFGYAGPREDFAHPNLAMEE